MTLSHSLQFAGPVRIGVVGTAKNTGKTTTIAALLNEAHRQNIPVALTGIGYDGEAIDNLTLLPKPRLDVSSGIHIATSEQCVRQATAKFIPVENTDEETPLGKVQIVRVTSPGRVMLAGPNNTEALGRILARLERFAPLILIDGALGRMVPMSAADAVIFATGAARATDIRLLAREMKAIRDIFSLEGFRELSSPPGMPEYITVYFKDGRQDELSIASLLDMEDARMLLALLNGEILRIAVPGALSIKPLKCIIENAGIPLRGILFYFMTPAMLLAGGNPAGVWDNLMALQRRGAQVAYAHPLPILAVIINPFYARALGRRGIFEPAFVDAEELRREFTAQLDLPIFDVLRDGAEELFRKLRSLSH